jgi:hypothetical protein
LLLLDLEPFLTYLSREGEVRSSGKRRIDVNEVDLPRELLQQRPHNQQVVAPDQLIPPSVLEGIALFPVIDVE